MERGTKLLQGLLIAGNLFLSSDSAAVSNDFIQPPPSSEQGNVLHLEENPLAPKRHGLIDTRKISDEGIQEAREAGNTEEQAGKGFSGKASLASGEVQAPQLDEITVGQGDTLFSIAQRYGITVPELQKANKLGSSTNIRVGQRLVIPPPPPPTPEHCNGHKVERGETLYGIAGQNNTTPRKLQELNNLSDTTIYPNQCLALPTGSTGVSINTHDPYAVNPPTPIPASSNQVSAPASPPPQAVFSRTAPESSSEDPFREAKAAVDFAAGNPGEYSAEMILSGIFSIFILAILSKYGADSLANRIRRR